ncbi:MAG TPA: ABC transporter permease [Anaeromyxobacter sp.]|nr:ABC transporter permease [Anaeromyxobacter sp.]
MTEILAKSIASTLAAGTPLALAGLGLLVNERLGVINLGAEGLMLVAAITGYAVGVHTGSVWLAFCAGALAAALLAAVFGWLVVWLNANQYATGLATSLFGAGFSAFVGVDYVGRQLPWPADVPDPAASLWRIAFLDHHALVFVAIALAPALWLLFWRTRTGLVLRAVGESPDAAHALGYPVRRIRFAAVLAGGALCGLAGAYMSLVQPRLWAEGMVQGGGWIALALTVFATWRPARLVFGAYLFGGVRVLELTLQGQGVHVPSQFMSMLPYLSTVVVLCLISRNPAWIRLNMPASLGKPFFASQ